MRCWRNSTANSSSLSTTYFRAIKQSLPGLSGLRRTPPVSYPAASRYGLGVLHGHNVELDHNRFVVTAYHDEINRLVGVEVQL